MMSNLGFGWHFLLLVLAATRITQLVMFDSILDGPRDRIVAWSHRRAADASFSAAAGPLDGTATKPKRAWLADLIGCIWCVSIWVGAAVAVAYWTLGDRVLVVLLIFALSEATAIVDRLFTNT